MSLDVTLYVSVDTGGVEPETITLFTANYTHNCGNMARAAGVYNHVWRPDELDDVRVAGDLIDPLRAGIKTMENDPARFVALNPENGWGSYETFLPWLREYLAACVEHPKAMVDTWR